MLGKPAFNKDRLQILINVMKRVEARGSSVNIESWQGNDDAVGEIVTTESEATACGTVCCIAGWLAISPEFEELGGEASSDNGGPIFNDQFGIYAVYEFLDVNGWGGMELVTSICGLKDEGIGYNTTSKFYTGQDGKEVTPSQVVKRLERLLETGE